MKRITILLVVCLCVLPLMGCLNTRVLTGGVNGAASVAVIGPVVIGAFVGKMYAGVVDADLAEGEGVLVKDEHGFNGVAGVASTSGGDTGEGTGDASGQMDRKFEVDIYQAEQAQGLEE